MNKKMLQPVSARGRGSVQSPGQGFFPESLDEPTRQAKRRKNGKDVLDAGGRVIYEDKVSGACSVFKEPTFKKNKKTGKLEIDVGRGFKGSCPITWGWRGGDPVLRFCSGKEKPGRIIPVRDAADALKKAHTICQGWRQNTRKIRRDKDGINSEYRDVAARMSSESDLQQYTIGRVSRQR